MSKFTLEVQLDNAAFRDDDGDLAPEVELDRILGKVKRDVFMGHDCGTIHDINGNKVGHWSIME